MEGLLGKMYGCARKKPMDLLYSLQKTCEFWYCQSTDIMGFPHSKAILEYQMEFLKTQLWYCRAEVIIVTPIKNSVPHTSHSAKKKKSQIKGVAPWVIWTLFDGDSWVSVPSSREFNLLEWLTELMLTLTYIYQSLKVCD